MYGIVYICVKEWFLLKQWKQGNTLFSKPKRPLEIGSLFYIIGINQVSVRSLKWGGFFIFF